MSARKMGIIGGWMRITNRFEGERGNLPSRRKCSFWVVRKSLQDR
jgi:hypothetical protein